MNYPCSTGQVISLDDVVYLGHFYHETSPIEDVFFDVIMRGGGEASVIGSVSKIDAIRADYEYIRNYMITSGTCQSGGSVVRCK